MTPDHSALIARVEGALTEGERAQVRQWVWEQACGEWTDAIVDSDTVSLCALIERLLRDRRALSKAPGGGDVG